jgi:hypothetical protein
MADHLANPGVPTGSHLFTVHGIEDGLAPFEMIPLRPAVTAVPESEALLQYQFVPPC